MGPTRFFFFTLTDNGLVFEVPVFPSSSGISGRDTATAGYYSVSLDFLRKVNRRMPRSSLS
ncbi:hypothetical protein SODALDRAFT_46620 [Sodiomyces alkalinus F11]|uniref:Uncharacterized protein n=1 Tax=Sodiomyces alkalinus (strain CBS 110278 / VKM F-3762 / F11) TaxID=1314773 RepID=A0A3N2QAH1_SODAK|nr:hypothetical protein SODALDRAFT_46620 [Sodiomyces alkalinus F11]ROT43744.1 hypothetical protein SODALDRAFT_46620 [Sodiomyces alkalinus F11]